MMAELHLSPPPGPLGSTQTALPITGSESRTVIQLSPAGRQQVARLLATGAEPRGRLYLALEHLRGSRDATVLQVYVGWTTDTHPLRLAGSWALFGVRMASLQYAGNPGDGLNKSFDITALLSLAMPDPAAEVSVRIVPNRPLPASVQLVVARISVVYRPPD